MNKRFARLFFALFVMGNLCMLLQSCSDQKNSLQTPLQATWAWRKTFKNSDLGNLAMAWNGTRIVFTVSGKTAATPETIVGLDNKGTPLRDWRSPGRIAKLSADGSAHKILLETADGRLVFFDNWQVQKKPFVITDAVPGAVLSPNGEFIIAKQQKDKSVLQTIVPGGKPHGTFPEIPGENTKQCIPFLERSFTLLQASDSGAVSLSDSGAPIWSVTLPGVPTALASSFLLARDGFVALALTGQDGAVHLYDAGGAKTSAVSLGGEIASLHCANSGSLCAALVQSSVRQSVHAFNAKGKRLWESVTPSPAGSRSSVVAAADGAVIVAGIEEAGSWSLRAWDAKGNPLWIAPIEGGLLDFRISWNGKRIAVLTRDGRMAFYDLDLVRPSTQR